MCSSSIASFTARTWLAVLMATATLAHFPTEPHGIINKDVPDLPGMSISYKQTCICETEARGWAGYVHMPSVSLADIETDEPYNVSIFFWYFEARNHPQTAPTTIYLAGGPGQPGVYGAVVDGGPCTILEDANSTKPNPWSWNTNVNMLYLDQPVSTGFSYTKQVKSTLDLLFLGVPLTETGITPFSAYEGTVPPENETFIYGTFSEQDPSKIPNNTLSAAKTLWYFSQAWFSSFPEYKTSNKNVNIFGNSYGGYWVTISAELFVKQNEAITKGTIEGTIIPINTIGWTNGCVDLLVQGEWYPDQAYNNTYGLQIIPKDVYQESKLNFTKPGGCRDLILQCRDLGQQYDPQGQRANVTVNDACVEAFAYCEMYVTGAYDALSNRSDYDMTHLKPEPFPSSYWEAFFNRAWVRQDLGVSVNLSAASLLVNNVLLYSTGDPIRTTGLPSIEYLLASDVKVAMMYGDADYRCPWMGAEKLSLAVDWAGASQFHEAGYEYIETNATYKGGVVRQRGNLSFSRIFDAGHDALAYQPETVLRLFDRAIFSRDLATGRHSTGGKSNNYTTKGPLTSFYIKNTVPEPPSFECELFNVALTCTSEQYQALVNGTAKIIDFNVIEPSEGSPGSIYEAV